MCAATLSGVALASEEMQVPRPYSGTVDVPNVPAGVAAAMVQWFEGSPSSVVWDITPSLTFVPVSAAALSQFSERYGAGVEATHAWQVSIDWSILQQQVPSGPVERVRIHSPAGPAVELRTVNTRTHSGSGGPVYTWVGETVSQAGGWIGVSSAAISGVGVSGNFATGAGFWEFQSVPGAEGEVFLVIFDSYPQEACENE